jgi:hypothetical protein
MRVSANIVDLVTSIDAVYTFAIASPIPDLNGVKSFIYELVNTSNVEELTPMFDPMSTGDFSKTFNNPKGIKFEVIGYLTNSFSNIENNYEIQPVSNVDNIYIYTRNALLFSNITEL